MRSERGPCGLRKGGRYRQFSNSNKASFCRSFMDTRDSRLLIVDGGEQAENVREEMGSRGGSSGASLVFVASESRLVECCCLAVMNTSCHVAISISCGGVPVYYCTELPLDPSLYSFLGKDLTRRPRTPCQRKPGIGNEERGHWLVTATGQSRHFLLWSHRLFT